jgi:hypothetical protein
MIRALNLHQDGSASTLLSNTKQLRCTKAAADTLEQWPLLPPQAGAGVHGVNGIDASAASDWQHDQDAQHLHHLNMQQVCLPVAPCRRTACWPGAHHQGCLHMPAFPTNSMYVLLRSILRNSCIYYAASIPCTQLLRSILRSYTYIATDYHKQTRTILQGTGQFAAKCSTPCIHAWQ